MTRYSITRIESLRCEINLLEAEKRALDLKILRLKSELRVLTNGKD